MALLVLVLIVVIGLVLAYLVFLMDSLLGKEDFATNRQAAEKVIAILKQRNFVSGIFYDLGSSRGGFATKIAKALPGAKIIGVDDSRYRVFISKARAAFINNINFQRKNIFDADVSTAEVIYIYLPQELMPELESKLFKQMKHGSIIISNSVSFTNRQPLEIYELDKKTDYQQKLFIYQIP